MSDLTLDEKTSYATQRAQEQTAEKHFYDAAQPFFPLGFSVDYRNPGHWDIYAKRTPGKIAAWKTVHPNGFTNGIDGGQERAFRIRGEAGNVVVHDERWNPYTQHQRQSMEFRSVMAAMVWIAEELMQEPQHAESV